MRLQHLYIIYRQNTMSDHRYTSENELDGSEENVQLLKEKFTLDDFLDYEETYKILHQNFIWEYERNCEPVLEHFYKYETGYCNSSVATAFANECEEEHLGDFLGIVFRNIKPTYDLNIFYDNPSLAKSMVITYNDRIEKKKEDHIEAIRASAGPVKTYDWSTKTYKANSST